MVQIFLNNKLININSIQDIKQNLIQYHDIVFISNGKILLDKYLKDNISVEYFVRGRGGMLVGPASEAAAPMIAASTTTIASSMPTLNAAVQGIYANLNRQQLQDETNNTELTTATMAASAQNDAAIKEQSFMEKVTAFFGFNKAEANANKAIANDNANNKATNATITQNTNAEISADNQIAARQNTQFEKLIAVENQQNIEEKKQNAQENLETKLSKRERFIQFLKTMATWQKFYPIIILVLIILAFFGKPLEYIMLALALVVIGFIYVMYCILSCDAFLWIPMSIWFLATMIVPFLLYCCVFGALLVVILVVCLILAIINGITSNSLRRLIMCQNNPANWYILPNYQLGNKWERSILCSKPCFSGYYPDTTGLFCKRIPKGTPPYCPYSESMRIYTGTSRNDRNYMFKQYNPLTNLTYITKSPSERELQLKSYYMNKKEFNETCKSKLSEYANISLGICSSTDVIANNPANTITNGMNAKQTDMLQDVCKQAFCDSDNSYPFCANLANSSTDNTSQIILMVIKISIYIILFMIVIVLVINQFKSYMS